MKNRQYTFNEVLFLIQELLEQEGKAHILQQEHTISENQYNQFREFVKLLLYRNLANFDSMALITAPKGGGKSSAAIMLAREWCNLIGIPFNPERHIAYSNAQVMSAIDTLQPFEPLVLDEAIRVASSSDWAKRENKELRKKLAQIRTKHLFFVLCFPMKVNRIEKTYLDSFVNYWIDLFSRGRGAVFIRDLNPITDTWRLKEFQNIGSYTEFTDPAKVEEKLKMHPNFWQIVKFPKPPKKFYDEYLKVREANVYDEESVLRNVSKTDIANALLILSLRDIMQNDDTKTMNRIILHIKNQYTIPVNKQMIDSCVNDATQLITKIQEQTLNITDFKDEEELKKEAEIAEAKSVPDA